jgi:hypothetical protein
MAPAPSGDGALDRPLRQLLINQAFTMPFWLYVSFLSLTPAPPPFSGMNSTPALSLSGESQRLRALDHDLDEGHRRGVAIHHVVADASGRV